MRYSHNAFPVEACTGAQDIAQIKTSAKVRALADGADVFGLQIIATLGHTADHISGFDPVGSFIIADDTLNNKDGVLSGPNPQFSTVIATSARKRSRR